MMTYTMARINNRRIISWTILLSVAFFAVLGIIFTKSVPILQTYTQIENSVSSAITEKIGDVLSANIFNPNTQNDMNTQIPVSAFAGTAGLPGCGLTLSITSNESTLTPGSNATFSIVVKNEGKKVCKDASLTLHYSDNQAFVSANPKPSSSNYYWKLGTMPVGAKKEFSVTTKHSQNEASVIDTEACAAATNSPDACAKIEVKMAAVTNPEEEDVPEEYNPGDQEYGTWVWISPYKMTEAYRNKVISGAASNNINVIYLTIDDYLTINALPEGTDKEAKKKAYSDSLEKFIIAANAKGIQVDVEAGWKDWAEPGNEHKGNAIIDYAIAYNSSRSNKIRGVQFDVEPYLLATYERNKAPILKNFVAFVDSATERMGSSSMSLNIVIPHFYDSSQKWTPSVTHDGITDFTFDHLLRILDTRPNSSIILMSYRNFAEGSNGSIEISQVEVDDASTGNHPTRVIVGQETGNVSPDYVTFHGTSRELYEEQVSLINNAFNGKAGFGGIAVHYIDPFLEL